jgi:hypothetical protein
MTLTVKGCIRKLDSVPTSSAICLLPDIIANTPPTNKEMELLVRTGRGMEKTRKEAVFKVKISIS